MIHFCVFDQNVFRKNSVIGQRMLRLYEVLKYYDGKFDNLELTMDLLLEVKHDSGVMYEIGKLVVVFDGLHVDMDMVYPPRNTGKLC